MLTVEPQTHMVLIEISCGRTKFDNIKTALSNYMHIIREGWISETIAANVPSGLWGSFNTCSQWIRCKTECELSDILQLCKNISNRYMCTLDVYKWDDEYLTKTEGGIWLNLPDPI